MKHIYKLNCIKCGKEYELELTEFKYKSGKYKHHCSLSCANKRKFSNTTKDKISKSVILYYENNGYKYKCEICNEYFFRKTLIKNNRKITCDKCKHINTNNKNIKSIFDISKRTISKILHRANIGCSICGWKDSTCDIHHIIPKKLGGTNDNLNLIIVCPNCHRILHTSNKYDHIDLNKLSVDNIFNDWLNYYNK